MSCWALVPVKARHACKTRLAHCLTEQERLSLVRSLLNYVLEVLQETAGVDRIIVVSNERDELSIDVDVFHDHHHDLNLSLGAAVDYAKQQGASRILILPADLPRLQSRDVSALIAGAEQGIAIAPDQHDRGTNGLCFASVLPLAMKFGEDSFRQHVKQAKRIGVSIKAMRRPSIAFDVDSPPDLSKYLEQQRKQQVQTLLSTPLFELMQTAQALTEQGFGSRVSYSRKVFIPLTQLCRDVCHYCTFAKAPRSLSKPYLSIDEVVAIAKDGAKAGCKEALFTLGDKPELRYRAAREALAEMGYSSTLDYLEAAASAVFEQTGLLPHLNPGLMSRDELLRLRKVSVSMGIMLETAAERLSEKGGPHYGSPDKLPAARLETLRIAGELKIPMTTGILIGIGETRRERLDSLLALRELHQQYGHIQEVIIQNFRAKPATNMAAAEEPSLEEHLWSIAVARHVFGPEMSIQAPPNLQPRMLKQLINAGINDWGGVSPVTPDHVNPERPWPQLARLEQETADAGRQLLQRLAVGPQYVRNAQIWLDERLISAVTRLSDSEGFAREDSWFAGAGQPAPDWSLAPPMAERALIPRSTALSRTLSRAEAGDELNSGEIVQLFGARGQALWDILNAADQLRQRTVGDAITYAINRNINYTNICSYRCGFCAFAKGQGGKEAKALRGPAYLLDLDEIVKRSREAWDTGATEVCLQGGIHPSFTGDTYLNIVRAVKGELPDLHIHAFSPLEITHGASTLGLSLEDYLLRLKAAGLSTLPGTAAEILHDDIRQIIAPDKPNTQQWLDVVATAHRVGIRTTATIMFGHVDRFEHWAAHLLAIRRLQQKTGGFTEFVPLPYVHMEAPLWRKGQSRSGPTFRESLLMHAVARLVLHPYISNIQASWVKMGREGAALCLRSGANDLGGTLMNESITRAAGGVNGQEMGFVEMIQLAEFLGREALQRNTLYQPVCKTAELSKLIVAVAK